MSKDIRSYFSLLSTKSTNPSKAGPTPIKRSKPTIISSDEDVIPETPVQQKKKEMTFKKRKIQVLSSDSEDDTQSDVKIKKHANNKKLKENGPKLKPVKAADIFGSDPIKQAKVPDRSKFSNTAEPNKVKVDKKAKGKKKKSLETEKFEDKRFEDTLLDLDDDFLSENMGLLDESIKIAENKLCEKKVTECGDKNKPAEKVEDKSTEKSKFAITTTKNIEPIKNGESMDFKKQLSDIDIDKTPKGKRKSEAYDPEEDVNRHEKKRQSAILYQKYLNRSGPANHGSKDIPKGKPDCLKNLSFIRTGVLDSLDSEEFETLVKNHGGRIVHSVSKKVNYVVAGDDPGPAKIEKAKGYGIKIISEDDLLDLIRTKSGLPQNNNKDTHSLDNLIDGLNHVSSEAVTSNIKSPNKSKSTTEVLKSNSTKNPNSKITDNGLSQIKPTESSSSKYFIKGKTKSETKLSTPHTSAQPKAPSKPPQPTQKCLSWTEKYKPTNIKSIIGQQGDKSNMRRLLTWLESWFKNHTGKNKPKLARPSPWAKSDDGSYFKAALLSGPPGIGKTTTAHLVARELGFDVVEFNASDTRSKRLLQEELSQLLKTKSLAGFFTNGVAPTNKHVLLMDEVDGMAGNEDRGGIQELINLIKNSSIPIICMCNDRNHQKVRSLVNYCYDLRFSKPRLEQIKGAMMSVCFKEGIDINPNALSDIIVAAGMDIRQILTNLCIWSAGKKALNVETTTADAQNATKDVPLGQWEVCHKVFSEADHKKMSVTDRARLFYHDYSLAPLFVQENYLKVVPHAPKEDFLRLFSAASESISMGDLIDKQIRTSNNWSLLDTQAMCASVIPGEYLRGHMGGQIDFPGWLGKNSKKNKFNRLVSEIQAHTRTSISASRSAVNLDYVTHLRNAIARPLVDHGLSGVNTAVEVMQCYSLIREDLDSITELSQWPKQKDPMNMVDSKVKAAFTRAYNKKAVLPYSIQSAAVKKKGGKSKQEEEMDIIEDDENQEDVDSNPEDNDDIANDAMIKAKKPSGGNKKEVNPKPSSSKLTGGKGRKKK